MMPENDMDDKLSKRQINVMFRSTPPIEKS